MAKRLTVVVSQGQSNNPAKRDLEESLVATLMMERGIDVTVIPNLYDLKPDGTGMLCLQGINGDMVLASWLFPRAAHWILDRHGIHGQFGETLLSTEDEEDEQDELDNLESQDQDEPKDRVIDQRDIPQRKIYCLDLRSHLSTDEYIEEIKRIASENQTQVVDLMDWVNGSPTPEQTERFLQPTNNTSVGDLGSSETQPPPGPTRIEENSERRWYPVIDFGRCTNCMECIDFCLFGVYGVDAAETILVELPDNCRKGCPACSRVCPENAIIFPQHKSPAIAGSAEVVESLKIDLSLLFGGDGKSAEEIAAQERDEQLVLAGRDAVGTIPKRQQHIEDKPKDELDHLMDELDELDL